MQCPNCLSNDNLNVESVKVESVKVESPNTPVRVRKCERCKQIIKTINWKETKLQRLDN